MPGNMELHPETLCSSTDLRAYSTPVTEISTPVESVAELQASVPAAIETNLSVRPATPLAFDAQRLNLDGVWEFRHLAENISPDHAESRSIVVPGVWQSQFADLGMEGGNGLYRRIVSVPRGWARGRIKLHFGAVFHNAFVWLNGVRVGENHGGFLPFAFDVTDVLVPGANELVVLVESPLDNLADFQDGQLPEIPFGKQSWYGPQSGIWQSVYLERRDPDHIATVRINPERATGRVGLSVAFDRLIESAVELEAVVTDAAGNRLAARLETPDLGRASLETDIHVQDCVSWSPESPVLYTLSLMLHRDGEVIDRVEHHFGFRTVETRDGRIFLNGEPIYLRAALDQDYYPDGICTTPSIDFLEDQFRKAKQLGLNCLRCHIKAPDPRYYDVADRLGLLIWTELPNSGRTTDGSRRRAEALLKGIVDRDGNHPSIICWTIINENWGTDLVHNADHRAWLKRTYSWLKSYDPTRLVVDNSPLAPSMHVQSDLADMHYYAAIPDHRDAWDNFVEDLGSRPAWLFSQNGDAVTTGKEPLLCSEFGNWGLPHPSDLADSSGREPWWFETGHDWGEGVMYAHGVERRFADWNLKSAFGSMRAFVEAAQWQQYRALKYQIEAMRRQPALAGYVITELTDCHWESNGLLDMRRNPRAFHTAFGAINADTVILPKWTRLAYWSGETMQLDLAVAHGAGAPLTGATLHVLLGETKQCAVPVIMPGDVAQLGTVALSVPQVAEPCTHRVQFELRDRSGMIIATNHVDVAIQPIRRAPPISVGPVWSPEPGIRRRLAALGYTIAGSAEASSLVVARKMSPALTAWVQAGGRVLLMAEREMSLTPLFPHWQGVHVKARAGTQWQGDWASSFSWLRRRAGFEALPGNVLLDESFDRVIPDHVIAGCNLHDFHSRVHAGIVVGWVHKAAALAVERGYGDGHVLSSTFRLFRDPAGADPTATVLLDRLIAAAGGVASVELRDRLHATYDPAAAPAGDIA